MRTEQARAAYLAAVSRKAAVSTPLNTSPNPRRCRTLSSVRVQCEGTYPPPPGAPLCVS
jgi:hypothetical protein